MVISVLLNTCLIIALVYLPSVHSEKYKVCVIDGRGSFRKAARYCPILDGPESKVECVVGLDRLDCLRKISKGKADFSVFTAEDLVTATNSEIEILITNEMRYTKDQQEYEVVAVVSDGAGIKSREDIKGKRLCHPGYGYETDWTKILANYLEASVVPQSCNPSLTLTENRIKASSEYFKAACKAGPWVDNPDLDRQLKNKYKNLCELCDTPTTCSKDDKYWGRLGPLICLTDGAGDIGWIRLNDVRSYFGVTRDMQSTTSDGYSFLCPDGSKVPINTTNPCIWVAKPWPVVATKRTSAQDIQQLVSSLSHDDHSSWQSALLALLENYYVTIQTLNPIESIESYLARANGFLSANSFAGCHPPRTIKICTTSNIENAKCSWLREAAAVYGIEPDLDCLKADNTTHCMQAINDNVVDVVLVPPALLRSAISEYDMKILFYETVYDDSKYTAVAIVKSNSGITSFEDLKGLKACFPEYDGVAWNSVIYTLHNKHLLDSCPFLNAMESFFGPSCVPHLQKNGSSNLNEICNGDAYNGEYGALKCLFEGNADVAFVSKNSLFQFINDTQENKMHVTINDTKILCGSQTSCHLSWATAGYGMIKNNRSSLWTKDTLDVFLQLDQLFGKSYKFLTSPFSMFSQFDGQSDVLFQDRTVKLRDLPTVKNTDKMKEPYDAILQNINECSSSIIHNIPSLNLIFSIVTLKLLLRFFV